VIYYCSVLDYLILAIILSIFYCICRWEV